MEKDSKARQDINRSPKSRDNPNPSHSSALSLGHISSKQITALIALVLGVKALLITPTFLILDLSTGAWISVLISTAAGLVGLAGWLKWSSLTAGIEFLPALEKTVGRPLAILVCSTMIVSFTVGISLTARLFAGGAAIGLLPDVPIEVLLLILIASSAYAAWLGLESIARASTFFLGPTVISLILVGIASLRDLDVRNLLPFWGPGPGAVALQGVSLARLWGAIPVFVALKTYVRSEEDLGKGVAKGLITSGLVLAAATASILLFFPYPSSTRLTYPLGIVARSVYLGRFLQRIEAIFVFSWFFASALQASFLYFVILVFMNQLARTHTYRPFLPGLVSVSFGIGAIPVSLLGAAQQLNKWFFDPFGIPFLVLGWVLYAIAKARGLRPRAEGSPEGGEGGEGDREQSPSQAKASSSLGVRSPSAPASDSDGVLGKERD